MPVLTPPDGGLLDTIPAGLYAAQVLPKGVDLATADDDDWVFVQGFKKFDPQFDPQSEDDSDITMGGWASEAGTSNGLKIAVEGLYKGASSSSTFTPDPGLSEVIEAGEGIGDVDMVRPFRFWRTDAINEAYQGRFLCKVKKEGGDPKELQKFSGELICKGKPTKISKPEAPTGP
ncbi:phage tail tube protein [Gordonia caeni]|uniref:Phage tail protein n=1 Tax=Gordonia caeni TaxID=1007097 RepID=A0ABP7PBT9_9ACTN